MLCLFLPERRLFIGCFNYHSSYLSNSLFRKNKKFTKIWITFIFLQRIDLQNKILKFYSPPLTVDNSNSSLCNLTNFPSRSFASAIHLKNVRSSRFSFFCASKQLIIKSTTILYWKKQKPSRSKSPERSWIILWCYEPYKIVYLTTFP